MDRPCELEPHPPAIMLEECYFHHNWTLDRAALPAPPQASLCDSTTEHLMNERLTTERLTTEQLMTE